MKITKANSREARTMKYNFFGGEMDVDLDNQGRVSGFEYVFTTATGERLRSGYMMTDRRSDTGEYSDESYGVETYVKGEAKSVILHAEHETADIADLTSWAQARYVGHLSYVARVAVATIIPDYYTSHRENWMEEENLQSVLMPRVRYMIENLEKLQEERKREFEAGEGDILVLYWALGKLVLGDEDWEIENMFYRNLRGNSEELKLHLPIVKVLLDEKLEAGYLEKIQR